VPVECEAGCFLGHRLRRHADRPVKKWLVDTDDTLVKVPSSTEEERMRADVYRGSRQFEPDFVGAFLTSGKNVSVKHDHMM